MNANASAGVPLDLDAVLFDFVSAHAENPREALHRLHVLLLDEETCLARAAFLRGLASGTESETALPGRVSSSLCTEALDLMRGGELLARPLQPAEVQVLGRLTCDPEALAAVHRELVHGEPEEKHTEIEAGTAETAMGPSPTSLLRAGQGKVVMEVLVPWLPHLLRRVGLDERLADDLRVDLSRRLAESFPFNLRFRDLLMQWLEEFAQAHPESGRFQPLSDEEYRVMIQEAAWDRVLGGGVDEPAWARRVRTLARASNARSPDDLLTLRLPDDIAEEGAAVTFLFGLAAELREWHKKGLQAFECLDG